MATVIDETTRERLAKCADDVESTRAAYDAAVIRRNRAVVEAVDHVGLAQRIVAKLVRVSAPHVTRILAKPDAAGMVPA